MVLTLYVDTVFREGFAAKAGGVGETDESAGTANMVSWKVKF